MLLGKCLRVQLLACQEPNCGHLFPTSHQLSQHMKHSHQAAFLCPICALILCLRPLMRSVGGKNFGQKKHMLEHVRHVHEEVLSRTPSRLAFTKFVGALSLS